MIHHRRETMDLRHNNTPAHNQRQATRCLTNVASDGLFCEETKQERARGAVPQNREASIQNANLHLTCATAPSSPSGISLRFFPFHTKMLVHVNSFHDTLSDPTDNSKLPNRIEKFERRDRFASLWPSKEPNHFVASFDTNLRIVVFCLITIVSQQSATNFFPLKVPWQ